MVARSILMLCVHALMAKAALSQCFGRGIFGAQFKAPWGRDSFGMYDRWGLSNRFGCGINTLAPVGVAPGFGFGNSFSSGLTVTSSSPIAPTGLRVTSENAFEGALTVFGNLPFLGAVTTDGAFPTAGAGAISYGCGDGAVAIVAENGLIAAPIAPSIAPKLAFGAGLAPFGLPGAGYKYKSTCGCGY